jgi:hypothetical protein
MNTDTWAVENASCCLLQLLCNSPNLLFIELLLEVSRIQANGKTYVELHPRTYVKFATKRHDFFQLNQKDPQ